MIPVMRPWLGEEEAAAAAGAVASGWVAQGPQVAAFEQAVAAASGAPHGVALSSCTTALHLALVLAGVGPGDEVVVPSLSFIATTNAALYVGATPVFADVDPRTLNLTPATVAAALGPRTRAVILVHQAGTPADLDPIRGMCRAAGVAVVEDAACALGSRYRGRPVGVGAAYATLSFHPRKVITTGEGGMLLVADPAVAARARRLREHGMSVSAADRHRSDRVILETYDEVGFNYRMTDIQAAVGLVQLTRLEAIVARRRELAARYHELLGDIPGLVMAADPPWGRTNYQAFWVQLPDDAPADRDEVLEGMLHAGVSARRGIMAAHLEPAHAGRPRPPLPATEQLSRRSLILPMFHELSASDQERVVEVFRKEAGL